MVVPTRLGANHAQCGAWLAPKGSFLFVARGECPALPTGEGKTGQKKGRGWLNPDPGVCSKRQWRPLTRL
jgi:hypothetical protein